METLVERQAAAIDASETGRLVPTLREFSVREVGNSKWMEQHRLLERLNLQSHHSAKTNTDDYVLSTVHTYNKLPVLIHELLVIEVWRENVLPVILSEITAVPNAVMRTYFILYHEAVLVNLLDIMMYYDYVCEAMGDAIMDLIDYAMRRIGYLVASTHARSSLTPAQRAQYARNAGAGNALGSIYEQEDGDIETVESSKAAAELIEADARDPGAAASKQVKKWYRDIAFKVGISCVSMMRYVSDHVAKLSLSVMARILDTHDVMLAMVPLIENPPWVRKVKKSNAVVWQKYVDQKWVPVQQADLLKLTPYEGQPWLTLYNLMIEPECRKRYAMHSHRKGTLLRIRKYLNELLVDQLPMLVEVQRYLDELQVMNAPEPTELKQAALLLETVPVLTEGIVADALTAPPKEAADEHAVSGILDIVPRAAASTVAAAARRWQWSDLGGHIISTVFRAGDDDLRGMASVYQDGMYDDILGDPKCSKCGSSGIHRCSRCKNIYYCSKECQVADWKDHKVLCDLVVNNA